MKKIKILALLLVIFFTSNSSAYKQDVHMLMTNHAAGQSVLAGSEIWSDWAMDKNTTFRYRPINTRFHKVLLLR